MDTFGYSARGVGPETAVAPDGWQQRLVPLVNDNTRGATGWCMEPHDLVVAKLVAGRDKDIALARAAIVHGIVQVDVLRSRAGTVAGDDAVKQQLGELITIAARP